MKFDTDKLQTVLGIVEAVVIELINYFTNLTTTGEVDLTSGTFWLGTLLALSRAVKGYFAAGVKPKEDVQ